MFAKARLVREREGPVYVTSLPYGYGRFLYQARGKAAILVKYVRFHELCVVLIFVHFGQHNTLLVFPLLTLTLALAGSKSAGSVANSLCATLIPT